MGEENVSVQGHQYVRFGVVVHGGRHLEEEVQGVHVPLVFVLAVVD